MAKKGVKYTFAGQYYTAAKDTAEQIKPYEISVVFPEETSKALSLFKTAVGNALNPIHKIMVGKYPDFKVVRTYTIIDVENLDGTQTNTSSQNIATMNTKQLTAYIKKNELGIEVEVYEGDITRLRNAIVAAEADPEKFKETYKADVEAYEFNKSLNNLNDVPKEDENNAKVEDDNLEVATLLGETPNE